VGFFEEALKDKPVAMARLKRKDDDGIPIIVIVRPDAVRVLRALEKRGGESEVSGCNSRRTAAVWPLIGVSYKAVAHLKRQTQGWH
jgi:hypothetical protein